MAADYVAAVVPGGRAPEYIRNDEDAKREVVSSILGPERQRVMAEVARLYGYDRIPSTLPQTGVTGGLTTAQQAERSVRQAALAFGLHETITRPFVGAEHLEIPGVGLARGETLQLGFTPVKVIPELNTAPIFKRNKEAAIGRRPAEAVAGQVQFLHHQGVEQPDYIGAGGDAVARPGFL